MTIYIGTSGQVDASNAVVKLPDKDMILWDAYDAVPFIMDFGRGKFYTGTYYQQHPDLTPIVSSSCVAGRIWKNSGLITFYDDQDFLYPSSKELAEIVKKFNNKIANFTLVKSLGRYKQTGNASMRAVAVIPVREYISGWFNGEEEQEDFFTRCKSTDIIDLNKPNEIPSNSPYTQNKIDKFPGNDEYEKLRNYRLWNGNYEVAESKKKKKIIVSESQIRRILSEIASTEIDIRANEADTNPTEAQKKAGNYKMGHISVRGMQIAIENPKGSYRTYKNKDGNTAYNLMHNHYGYFNITKGKDGDAVDVFIGPDIDNFQNVYCVDQNNTKGEFDETKVMLGFNSAEEAKKAYLSNYSPDWKGFRAITGVSLKVFKKWLYRGRKQRQPFEDYVYIQKKKLAEVRYINPDFRAETSGYLEKKVIELMTITFQSECEKIGEKDNVLYFRIIPNDERGPEEIRRFIKSYFIGRQCTLKQNQDGSLLLAIRNYDTIDPLKDDQTIRVYHGTSLSTAKDMAIYGFSGKEQKSRVYSYEYWNNPTGLFVTIYFPKAKYFGTNNHDAVIVEFTAKMSDLDTPVWNSENGSYFVQGDITKGFTSKRERDVAKIAANRNAVNYPHIENSDSPGLANSLTNSFEFQALYYGDIEPNMIKRFWVKLRGEKNFTPYSHKEFVSTFCNDGYKNNNYDWKLYTPTEDFKGEDDFIERYNQKFGRLGGAEDFIQKFWQHIGNNEEIPYLEIRTLGQFMWPKQMTQFLTDGVYRDNVNSFYPEFRKPGKQY